MYRWLACLLLLPAVACSDGSGPESGALVVAVSGLPGGAHASVRIDGPEGFSRDLTGSQLLAALDPGSYIVSASLVNFGNVSYVPSLATQTVSIVPDNGPVTVRVDYVLAIGQLEVSVSGLPPGAEANIEITGPGRRQTITKSTTLTGLAPGSYTVAASSVTTGATLYTPSSVSQVVQIGSTITSVPVAVAYGASTTGDFNLTISGMYVVQSTQTFTGSVPLVADRVGLLRVFVLANRANAARPAVRVRFYRHDALLATETVEAARMSVPTHVDEGELSKSWNVTVPASFIRPGLKIVADVDPAGSVGEGNEADNAFPIAGTPLAFPVRSVPSLRIRFVPVYQSANSRQGGVTALNQDQFTSMIRQVHPIHEVSTDIRSVFTTSAAQLDPTDDAAWNQVLGEVNALRLVDADGGGRHYYGVVNTAHSSGIAGLGYVAGRSAIGWDYLPSGAGVVAHELGHNWARHHAPCGNVSRPDAQYPYSGGGIGVYGFDFTAGTVKALTSTDLMGYCGAQWISDYTYTGIMNYREATPLASAAAAVPTLLIRGAIVNGEPVLEPVLEVIARPTMPARAGPYRVEGQAGDGSTIFSIAFTPDEVADGAPGTQHFAFTVPLPARASELAFLRLATPQRTVTMSAAAPGRPRFRVGPGTGDASVRRLDRSRVLLRWNAAAHPLVMVRDPVSGAVLSFARGGQATIATERDELELVASDLVRSQSTRVRVSR